MSVLLFLILAGAIGWLWSRVARLERRLAELGGERAAAGRVTAPAVTSRPKAVQPAVVEVGTEPATASRARRFDFEDVFGRLLPIWAGGVTLAVAGFFLVRWSIDAGLLTPPVRVALAGLFGVALVAGAEAAYRWRERVADPRVAQALAGAGLATLYAAFYLAGTAYGLIGSTVAFLGLAGVTAAAIALSYRFGLPSAVLGLVGGFAAPALVGSAHANLPLLTLYLALVTAGLTTTGRRQTRGWLGLAALGAALGWGALLTAQGAVRGADVAALGIYLVLLGAIVPALAGQSEGGVARFVRIGAAALAAVQLAVLVASRFGPLEWSLYLLLGAALAWFGWRQAAMREGSALAAVIGAALLGLWDVPPAGQFAVVSTILAAIFAGVPAAHIARNAARPLDVAQASGVALGIALITLWHFGAVLPPGPRPTMALALLALALLPATAAFLARRTDLRAGRWLDAAEAAAALLGFAALAQVLPQDSLGWVAALVAAALARRAPTLRGAIAMLAVLAALWGTAPLFAWLQAGSSALAGVPLATAALPAIRSVALHLFPAVVGFAAWGHALAPTDKARKPLIVLAVAIAAIAAHIGFRYAFAAVAGADFVATGVLERAAWEALLLGGAWLAWRRGWRKVVTGVAFVALAHFAWFALALHNPLWSEQAVGSVPLLNAVLLAYGAGLAVLLALRRWLPKEPPFLRWAIDGAVMTVVALFALSELRQAFAGSSLVAAPIGPQEDLLRSLLGIVLAVGFLGWGARTRERSWRIGSLMLMVVAVLKVFLVDAAGLAGLARIASFMALGFSLIGIGWFYARQLRAPGSRGQT